MTPPNIFSGSFRFPPKWSSSHPSLYVTVRASTISRNTTMHEAEENHIQKLSRTVGCPEPNLVLMNIVSGWRRPHVEQRTWVYLFGPLATVHWRAPGFKSIRIWPLWR